MSDDLGHQRLEAALWQALTLADDAEEHHVAALIAAAIELLAADR